MVRIRSKIENNILFDRALFRIRAKIEKNTLFGRAFVRVRAKKKNTLVARLWLRLGQNTEETHFLVGL